MKKTIAKQDGSTETVEGTAEEIAEYERKSRGEVKEEVKKPGLLTDIVERQFTAPLFPIPQHTPECEITVASRGWWCVNPPRCTCGLFAYPFPGGTIRYRFSYTTDEIKIGDVIPDPYVITCNATRT